MILNFIVFLVLINRLSVALNTMTFHDVHAINIDMSIQRFDIYKNKCVFIAELEHKDILKHSNLVRFLNFLSKKYHKEGLEVVVFDDHEGKYSKPFRTKFDIYIGESYKSVNRVLMRTGNKLTDNWMYLVEKDGEHVDRFQIRNGIKYKPDKKGLFGKLKKLKKMDPLYELKKKLLNNNPNQENEDREMMERIDRRIVRCLNLKNI